MNELIANTSLMTILLVLANLVLMYFMARVVFNVGYKSGRKSSIIKLVAREAKMAVLETIIDEYAPAQDEKTKKWAMPDGTEVPEEKVSMMLRLRNSIEDQECTCGMCV